ncbi:MAG: helix-turn-helix domain containing protein [Cytophagales bacterium]|nr:helix-turn-helix domain containing protein [Cytophagales bacterium]
MNTTHTYFRPTTAQQRRILFEAWEATGNVAEACRKARVSRDTFYYWKPRFDEGGYGALEQTKSHAPKSPNKTVEDIEKQVIDLHHAHPGWGKRRIADELSKNNNWLAVISPNTVRRILKDAGLWSKSEAENKKRVLINQQSEAQTKPAKR